MNGKDEPSGDISSQVREPEPQGRIRILYIDENNIPQDVFDITVTEEDLSRIGLQHASMELFLRGAVEIALESLYD